MAPKVNVFENDVEVSKNACCFIVEIANNSITERGIFTIGVSGGSAAKYLCNELPQLQTDWSKWRVFFCDERHVSYDDKECTYQYYKDNLMSKVALSDSHVFPDDPTISVEDAASKYEANIREVFEMPSGVPKFDLLLLGMGPDGHTCSLFPGHPLLQEQTKLMAAISDSPKPPPQRITMTFPLINAARCAMFISCGAGKAQIVQEVLEGTSDPPLPASRVKPSEGDVYWYLDKPAAGLLKSAQL